MSRAAKLKTVLWLIVGMLASVSVVRFIRGLGATTNLTDATPWGFWIAFKISVVAISAIGFVMAAAVYIFGLERYRPVVRPAVLIAFLGYAMFAVGLLYDLGLPTHIWHPIIYPQLRSVLFEVAMCVMLYLTVLFLEFSPTVLEHQWFGSRVFQGIHRILKRATIGLVIAGVVLSTLHQSSLGSLFLIAPYRVNPLWYSPIIPVLFLISAIGLGIMMVVFESFFSRWLFGHKLRMDLLPGLGKAASAVLFLYLILRLGDLAIRGSLTFSWLFVLEIMVSALIPAVLMAIPRVRNSPRGLLTASVMTILGAIGYRFDVSVVTFVRPSGATYFPSWTEFAVSAGIVAGALVVFIFFAEHLRVYDDGADPGADRAAPRRYSFAFVIGFAIAAAFLYQNVTAGAKPMAVPVSDAMDHPAIRVSPAGLETKTDLMIVDGNRNGRIVIFSHDGHAKKLGGEASCIECHHESLPNHRNSACSACHRDMYSATDIFDHSSHVAAFEGNKGCAKCHKDSNQPKTRETSVACVECHDGMVSKNPIFHDKSESRQGIASGYMDAMHGSCIPCHEKEAKAKPADYAESFAQCTECHTEADGSVLKKLPPYVPARKN